MRVSKRKKLLFILPITIAIIAAGIWLYFGPIATRLQTRRVDRLLSDFAATPSDATASPLVDLLEMQQVDPEEGTRILKALLEPDVKVAQPCIAGEEVHITVSPKHPTPATETLFSFFDHYTFSVKDKQLDYSFSWSNVLIQPRVPTLPISVLGPDSPTQGADGLVITKPGVYTGLLRLDCIAISTYDYEILGEAFRGGGFRHIDELPTRAWAKLKRYIFGPRSPPESYVCSFEVPVKIKVVPATQPAIGDRDR